MKADDEDTRSDTSSSSSPTAALKPTATTTFSSSAFCLDCVFPRRGWYEMYRRLIAYEDEHGAGTGNNTIEMMLGCDHDRLLAYWVSVQRRLYHKHKIPRECAKLLDSIGFDWGIPPKGWDEMYQRLINYKTEHNHTMVPSKYDNDPDLGAWVAKQRRLYKKNKLSEERVRLLKSLGFAWSDR